MAIKRYNAIADNTITNAFKMDLETRGSGSNMGGSDVVEVFSLYGQASGTLGASQELARTLIKFPISTIQTDRSASTVPASGSVSWFLRMFNARHAETLPKDFVMSVSALEREWDEGEGLDMEEYKDRGYPLGSGSNWIYAREDKTWQEPGGDFDPVNASASYTQRFERGDEDLEIDITPLAEMWLNDAGNALGSKPNYGVIVHLSGTYEAYFSGTVKEPPAQLNTGSESEVVHNPNGSKRSYYTKKFFGRGSEYFFKRPILEARWDSRNKDDRGNFYYSSSLAPADDNLNTLYLYNYVRGRLRNIPELDKTGNVIYVSLYSGSHTQGGNISTSSVGLLNMAKGGDVVAALDFNATGGMASTGIYTCSVCITSSTPLATKLFDVWHAGPSAGGYGATQFHTGVIYPKTIDTPAINPSTEYVVSVTDLRTVYYTDETARFRLYTRPRNWSPNIYSVASSTPENTTIESASYQIYRVSDEHTVIAYGTASTSIPGRGELHTLLSHDLSGNYFDLDMNMFEPGYAYGLRFAYYNGAIGSWVEQRDRFKFRVEKT